MELQFSNHIGELEYRNWIQLSNEEPIPLPLMIEIQVARINSSETYLADLEAEITMQGSLFDGDRQIIHISWNGDIDNRLAPDIKSKLLARVGASFNCAYPLRPFELAEIRLLGFDLIGCGLSAISHIGDNYCQNSSNHADYHELLLSGHLPIVRGYCPRGD